MDKIRILAVDDEPDLRSLLRILLTNKGYEVLEAASGQEAVDLVRSEPRIDLVIMDIMMPGLNGVQACAEIRRFSTVPMLFLTAKSQLSDKAEAVFEDLAKHFNVEFDETGSIGKRYRRQDEIGTPLCITYDFESETDNCVTVRDRDTMEQVRLPISELKEYIEKKIQF